MTRSEETSRIEKLKPDAEYLAPDGSEIRELSKMKAGSLCHCTLPAGKTASAVVHKHVEEIWYVLEGEGEVWRKDSVAENIVRVGAGTSLGISPGTAFQFRNTGAGPLCILIATLPPWPGREEAEEVIGVWPATAGASSEPTAKGPTAESR
jgi:mannose-6-phosphate isomerase-like protein (cupin superfamily)